MLLADSIYLRGVVDVDDFAEHRRAHSTWADTVDADVLPAMIQRQGFGQMNRACFRRTVPEVLRHADEPRYRGDVHDAAASGFPHGRDGRFAAQEDTFQVRVDDAIPFLFAGVINAFE